MEIDPLQQTAAPVDKSRGRSPSAAHVALAIDRRQGPREGHAVDLHDVSTRCYAFKMIAAVAIGDGIAAIFE
jgi:hypothetical protein